MSTSHTKLQKLSHCHAVTLTPSALFKYITTPTDKANATKTVPEKAFSNLLCDHVVINGQYANLSAEKYALYDALKELEKLAAYLIETRKVSEGDTVGQAGLWETLQAIVKMKDVGVDEAREEADEAMRDALWQVGRDCGLVGDEGDDDDDDDDDDEEEVEGR